MSGLSDNIAEAPIRALVGGAAVAAEEAWLADCYYWLEIELLKHDGLKPEKWERKAARAARNRHVQASRSLDDVLNRFPASSYESVENVLSEHGMRLKRGSGRNKGRVSAEPLMTDFPEIREWATTFPESR